jgi:hypothetical protein
MPSDATGSSRPQDIGSRPPHSHQADGAESISKDELRALVREWTSGLREQGLPPERVLAIVKSRVRDVILPHTSRYVDTDATDQRQDRLMSDSSQWCIEALFEPSDQ